MALVGPLLRKALLAIGIGVVTYAGVSTAVNAALGSAKASLSAMTGGAVQLVALGGGFTALSIIAGGITAGVSMLILQRMAKLGV